MLGGGRHALLSLLINESVRDGSSLTRALDTDLLFGAESLASLRSITRGPRLTGAPEGPALISSSTTY